MFRVLGPLEAEVDGHPVKLGSPRQRALLAMLLLTPNSVVSTDRLVEAIWGAQVPEHPVNAVQNLVARLRRSLADDGRLIVTRAPGYVLTVEVEAIDASRFEHEYRRARQHLADAPHRSVTMLDAALALWRGPAFDEHATTFARAEATRLDELRLAAQEDRVAAAVQSGAVRDAVARAQALVSEHPLRERPVELLMVALTADGRKGDALATFQRHRAVVEEELGLDPSAALRDLEGRILRDELPDRGGRRITAGAPRAASEHRLPWRPSALLGRAEELRRVREAVQTNRLVTLTGPGGVGKTRLALEAAYEAVEAGDPVWWVDLIPVRGDRVVAAVARAVGIDVADDGEVAGELCAALAGHRGVICLDNAEHVLEPVALLAERILAATSVLRLLTTSRERLAVDDEVVLAVPPLPLPDSADRKNPAVALFLARMSPPGQPSDEQVRLVAEICRQLDGLPLAIELGAARATTLGIEDVAARLHHRFDLLAGGRRTALPRHRTLRAVVDWSYDLLEPDGALLFARLGVFPRSFSLEQVEAVCADEWLSKPSLGMLLAQLVEQSLVQRTQGRYQLLETLRQYSQAKLEATDEAHRLQRRHAEDTAERLTSLQQVLWSPREAAASAALTALVDDLHAAWTYATHHDHELAIRLAADVFDFAYYRQRRELMDWGLEVASWGDVDHPRLPHALATAATAAWTRGHLEQARALATRAVTLAGGEAAPTADLALDVLADLTMFEGRIDDAVDRYLHVAEQRRAAGRDVEALSSRIAARQAMSYGGRWAQADEDLQLLLEEADASGNPSVVTFGWFAAGEAAVHLDTERARLAYMRAIETGTAAGARLFTMISRASLLGIVAEHDPHDRAIAAFEDTIEQWEQIGNEALQWWTLLGVVVLLERFGAAQDAAVLAGAVIAARERRPVFGPDTERLEAALTRIRDRLGTDATQAGLATGASFTLSTALAHARNSIRSLRSAPTSAPI